MVLLGTAFSLRELIIRFMMMDLFPENAEIATNSINIGLQLSLLFYALLSFFLINPDNLFPETISLEGARYVYYFGHKIAKNVPDFFLFLTILSGILTVAIPFIIENPLGMNNVCICWLKNLILKPDEKYSIREIYRNNDEIFKGNLSSYTAMLEDIS